MSWNVPVSEHSIAVPQSSESPWLACGIADREQRARHRDRIVERRALADPPVVDVAAGVARRDRVHAVGFVRAPGPSCRNAGGSAPGCPSARRSSAASSCGRPAGRDSRWSDGDAERVGHAGPAEAVDRPGPVALAGGVDLVDGHDLARLVAGQQVVVVVAPPGGGVAAEGQALELRDWRRGAARRRGCAPPARRPAPRRAPPPGRCRYARRARRRRRLASSAPRRDDALLVLGPEIDALGAGIALRSCARHRRSPGGSASRW